MATGAKHFAQLFRSTPPHGGRPPSGCSAQAPRGFDPRPRTGGDTDCVAADLLAHVSIHAPARGATHRLHQPSPSARVSIHAPARGATGLVNKRSLECAGFDPRPRTGGDMSARNPCSGYDVVSIHAPARGATGRTNPLRSLRHVSIHAPARGATMVASGGDGTCRGFRSTPPHGGRPCRRGSLQTA